VYCKIPIFRIRKIYKSKLHGLFILFYRTLTEIFCMKFLVIISFCFVMSISHTFADLSKQISTDTSLLVHKCNDFTITGKGDNAEWQKSSWVSLNKIDSNGKAYESKFKILYSSSGIYVLFSGQDDKITSRFGNDFDSLFKADVFEVFFHPEISEPMYLEYEVSPLNKELVFLIINRGGKLGGWMPWHYEGNKKIIKNVIVNGGEMKNGATIQSWTAEIFFPYTILYPLLNVPPVSGARWHANFCRLDYDSGRMVKWAWSPIKNSFHEFKNYLSLVFE